MPETAETPPSAILAAVGYNFCLLLNWLRLLWLQIWIALSAPIYIDQSVLAG
jgi:hypothetical protein